MIYEFLSIKINQHYNNENWRMTKKEAI